MAPLSLGLDTPSRQVSQVQVGFRAGSIPSLVIRLGGAGLVGLALERLKKLFSGF
jgi:hypothetical protein